MVKRSHWRGHPIHWVEDPNAGPEEPSGYWVFDDTGEKAWDGYGKRACLKCGKVFQGSNEGKPDPCLGNLPGVDNACCGHGRREDAYIRFTNGITVREFYVEGGECHHRWDYSRSKRTCTKCGLKQYYHWRARRWLRWQPMGWACWLWPAILFLLIAILGAIA